MDRSNCIDALCFKLRSSKSFLALRPNSCGLAGNARSLGRLFFEWMKGFWTLHHLSFCYWTLSWRDDRVGEIFLAHYLLFISVLSHAVEIFCVCMILIIQSMYHNPGAPIVSQHKLSARSFIYYGSISWMWNIFIGEVLHSLHYGFRFWTRVN